MSLCAGGAGSAGAQCVALSTETLSQSDQLAGTQELRERCCRAVWQLHSKTFQSYKLWLAAVDLKHERVKVVWSSCGQLRCLLLIEGTCDVNLPPLP